MSEELKELTARNILVVGDVMLDTYYIGTTNRISPEAPVPVFVKQSEYSVMGGAANVVANLLSAGQKVSILAIVGEDDSGTQIRRLFEEKGVNTELLFSIDRKTTEKTRLLANNNQQLLRVDVEDTFPISDDICSLLENEAKKVIGCFDMVIISDYQKGLLTYRLAQSIIEMAREKEIKVLVDVKDKDYRKYRKAFLVKPNIKELHDLTGLPVTNDGEIVFATKELKRLCECDYVLTTCGARGMVLLNDKEPYFVDAVGQEVFDVTGAGDTTIAYLCACLVNGMGIEKSVDIANIAAGIQVTKVGTSPVYWKEVYSKLTNRFHNRLGNKYLSQEELIDFRLRHKSETVVFTNGCFDILHIGHIRYLQEASKLGDILIVAVNSDSSVRRLKGENRPINTEMERTEMLCALSFVDNVVLFDEDTPLSIIKIIQPDILVKGGDYVNQYIVGTNEVKEKGGQVVLLPFVEGKSTTNIIDMIRR